MTEDSCRAEWLSAYLYLDDTSSFTGRADAFLVHVLKPLVESLHESAPDLMYFFVRYGDSGPHIRFRVRANSDTLEELVKPALLRTVDREASATTEAVARLVRVEWSTYIPEVRRYGGPMALVVAEQAFQSSSTFALDCLVRRPGRSQRLGAAFLSTIALLHALERDAIAAAHLADSCFRSYQQYLPGHGGPAAAPPTDSELSSGLSQLFSDVWARWSSMSPTKVEIDNYHDGMIGHCCALRQLLYQRQVFGSECALDSWQKVAEWLTPSLVHMTFNRLGLLPREELYVASLVARASSSAVSV